MTDPQTYQTTPRVDVTLRAMQIVRNQWACAGCQLLLRGKGE